MAIVKQKDTRSGIIYVYESVSWYDKETKNARSKRRLIGRWDEEKGLVVPTDGRCKKDKSAKLEKPVQEKQKNIISESEYELLYKQLVEKNRYLEQKIEEQKIKIEELELKLKG